jgi:DNA-binding transcriptional LysR family regulator
VVKLPDLNLLIALDALLQEHSVSRAAKRVGLSTPAMSHALNRLREQLGDPLLVRAGQRMVPTPRAANLQARVHALASDALAVLAPAPVTEIAKLERMFRLHTTDQLMTVLGPVLDRRLREAPGVSLYIMPPHRDEAHQLRDGTIDLAIGVYDYAPYSDLPTDLRIQQLFEDHYVCVVRADHPTVKSSLTLEQYAELEHVQVAVRGPPGGYVDELLATHGLKRRIVRAMPYFLATLVLISETDYVATLSATLVKRLGGMLPIKLVQPPRSLGLEPYQISQLWHPRNNRDPAHRWLRDAVAEASQRAKRGQT